MIYLVGVEKLKYISDYFKELFNDNNIDYNFILYNNLGDFSENDNDLFILICSNVYNKEFPKNYINIQLEQFTSNESVWLKNKIFINNLKKSQHIFDYSNYNINIIKKHINNKCSLIELGTITNYNKNNINLNKYVVFYGGLNKRRKRILNIIKNKLLSYNIHLIKAPSIFNSELNDYLLLNARLVINIHFYDNPLIEQVRLFECLSLNIPVVSESGINYSEISSYLKKNVNFVKMGDINQIINNILNIYRIKNKENIYYYKGNCSNVIGYLNLYKNYE
jgi:hypothetical protein